MSWVKYHALLIAIHLWLLAHMKIHLLPHVGPSLYPAPKYIRISFIKYKWIYGLIETLLLLIFPNIHHTKPPNLTLIIIKFQLWFFILCQLSSLFYFKDKTWIQYSYALDLTQCKHMITYKHVITCVRIISGSIH